VISWANILSAQAHPGTRVLTIIIWSIKRRC